MPRVWLFDLDDTLHNASARVFPHIHHSMAAYIARHLGMNFEDAWRLRAGYWRRYGATLLGMMKHHGTDPRHFLKHTHQFDDLGSMLVFEPALPQLLRRLPGRKFLFSNGPRHYARNVLREMGVAEQFDGISGIEDIGFVPKPAIEGFRRLLRRQHLSPSRCILVEDSLPNLATAKRLGMATVWVSRQLHQPAFVDVRIPSVLSLPRVLGKLAGHDR